MERVADLNNKVAEVLLQHETADEVPPNLILRALKDITLNQVSSKVVFLFVLLAIG